MTTVYVHKKGAELNVGLTIKGTPGVNLRYNNEYLDTNGLRTTPWCAGYYSLGGSHDHTENYYMIFKFLASGDYDDVTNASTDVFAYFGLMNSADTTHNINKLATELVGRTHNGASYLDAVEHYSLLYTSDSVGSASGPTDVTSPLVNNIPCELIVEYNGTTKVLNAKLYINDSLESNLSDTFPSGKSGSFDSIGVWGLNHADIQLWDDPWRISEIYVGDGPPPDDVIGKKIVNVI